MPGEGGREIRDRITRGFALGELGVEFGDVDGVAGKRRGRLSISRGHGERTQPCIADTSRNSPMEEHLGLMVA
jgi:hypothetical protein